MNSAAEFDPKVLMAPESIAVVGASPKGNRGSKILSNLSRFRYPGRVYVVNPNYREVGGYPCYPSVPDLPETVDFAAVAVSAGTALEQLDLFGAAGTRAGLVIGGGFGEGGDEALGPAFRDVCLKYDMRVCGPNCYGILNVRKGMAAYSGEIVDPLVPGNVAFILQSGALSHALHNTLIGRGVGISHIVTSGNEISIEMGDYLEWIVEDPATSTIALFLEGLKKPQPFVKAALRALELGKPIVALKVGKSEKGRRSAVAHTGAVAGDDAVYDGLFKQLGIIRVDDIDEFREMLVLLSHRQMPKSPSFALCSISGGITTLLADLSEEVGLDVPAVADATMAQLGEVLPEFATISNPLDTTGQLFENPELLGPIADAFVSDPAVGGFAVALNTPFGNANHLARCRALVAVQNRSDKPLVCFSVASAGVDEALSTTLEQGGIPLLLGARESVLSLKRWGQYVEDRKRLARPTAVARVHAVALDGPRQELLTEGRAIDLLSRYGVPFARQVLARSAVEAARAAADLGYPVALKIDVEGIAHKTELQGIRLGIRDEAELKGAYDGLLQQTRMQLSRNCINGITVQKMVPAGLEVLMGVRADAIFGPQIIVGAGGIFVEILREVAVRCVPISAADAREMIAQTVLGRLMGGFRGSPPFDDDALVEAVLSLSAAADAMREDIREIDINPLIVLPQGDGALAVDAVVAFKGREEMSK